jgi:glycosyltransferase involved in cell wall biosynthesis
MPPLRLAVDARVIADDTRGIGRYTRAVLRRLALRDDLQLTLLADAPFPWRARRTYVRVLGSESFDVRARAGPDLDAIWHPANGTFFASKLPSVATIHDAVPFRYPDADLKRRALAQDPFLRSAQTAARVIAVSRFGRSELHDVLRVPLEKIEVIEHGVDPSFTPGQAEPLAHGAHPLSFLLFVGDAIGEPRKNFALLYEAYRRAWPQGDGPALVVAGPPPPQLRGVIHAGVLSDDLTAGRNDSLRALYRSALALALASYHETFGMPMLEAMACGAPVIASRAGSLPEIGGDAPLYVPPDDADAWASALRRVAGDDALRGRLRDAGLERAKHFSWDASVDRHLAVFRSIVR